MNTKRRACPIGSDGIVGACFLAPSANERDDRPLAHPLLVLVRLDQLASLVPL